MSRTESESVCVYVGQWVTPTPRQVGQPADTFTGWRGGARLWLTRRATVVV